MERDVYWKIISLPEERDPSKALTNLYFCKQRFREGTDLPSSSLPSSVW